MRPGMAFPAAAPIAATVLSDGQMGSTGWGVLVVSIVVVAATFTLELIRERHVHQEITLLLQRRQREASAKGHRTS